jgi:L-amino acid N-acyltransferase YncA
MSSRIEIRASKDSDVAAITEIYAHHVLHGAGSFVAVTGNAVVGYAYAALYRTRVAYRFTLEDSVYIHPAHLGSGVGAALLRELISACKEWGCRQLVAVIGDSENTASIRVHEKLGFQHAGVLRGVGFKFDRWIDTVFMQLSL